MSSFFSCAALPMVVLGMAASIFLQATSGAVESPSQSKITPNQQETTKGKEHEAPRGQPQKMSREAHILVTTAADLVACTSRLQTASKEAVSLLFLDAFLAFSVGRIY